MKEINIDVLKDASLRLMFKMSDEEYNTLLQEFDILFKQMAMISKIENVDNVMPMTFPFNINTNYLREDEVKDVISKEDVLKNAKEVKDGQIKLPKVVKQ